MRRLMMSCFLLSILGLVSAGQAGADTFTWQLPSSPTITPDNYSTGVYFDITDVPYSEDGVAQTPGFFAFFNVDPLAGGGFVVADSAMDTIYVDAFGAQIYSGTESAPTFLPGTYMLNEALPDGPLGTLTITQADDIDSFTWEYPAPIATPEPSSLSLLLIGTGMLALFGFMRKKIEA